MDPNYSVEGTTESEMSGDAATPDASQARFIEGLGHAVQERWTAAYNHKQEYIVPRLYDCQRRRLGEYDPQKLNAINQLRGSVAYLKHTGLKCRAAQAWIRDVLMPGKGQPWGVEPTPIPDMPAEVEDEIVNKVLGMLAEMQAGGGMPMQGQPIQQPGMDPMAAQGAPPMQQMPPTPEMANQMAAEMREKVDMARMEDAKRRASRMERKIGDILVEGNFNRALSEFIDDITTFPSAVMKGPALEKAKRLVYGQDGAPMVETEVVPKYKRVSPWDFYPSPECETVNDGYICERRRITRHELLTLKGVPGYDADRIDMAMELNHGGLQSPVDDDARADLEDKEVDGASGTEDDRMELVEYWGEAMGQWLIDWGLDPAQVPDPDDDYQICAVMVNGEIVKAMLNPDPLGRRPYYVTSYEKRPGSIWGVAIPELMDAIQDLMNSTFRNLQDNIAFAAGPQVMVDVNALDPREVPNATQVYPRKVWLHTSQNRMGATGGRPIEFYQPGSNANELINVMTKCERLADDHTGIPAYSYGSDAVKGAGETMGGLSMLMNAASKGIRQVIANIGLEVLIPLIEATFHYCMMYVDDPAIRGDSKVHARGALAQVIREQLAVNRNEFMAGVMQDMDVKALLGPEGLAKVLRPTLNDLELSDAIPSDEEIQRRLAAQMIPAMPGQPQPVGAVGGPSQGAQPQRGAPAA
jgi:hypothetical protein